MKDITLLSFQPLTPDVIDMPGPMVVFATPGMLHAGQSLHIFRKWAPDANNMVIIPGYCVAGTVGYKILNGARRLEFDKQTLEVRMRVEYLSFSAHADARGIMQLISQCRPGHVLLVHGEASKMEFLKSRIESETKLPCSMPANGEMAIVPTRPQFNIRAPTDMLKKVLEEQSTLKRLSKQSTPFHGGILLKPDSEPLLLDRKSALESVGLRQHTMIFTSSHSFTTHETVPSLLKRASNICASYLPKEKLELGTDEVVLLNRLIVQFMPCLLPPLNGDAGSTKQEVLLTVTYSVQDEELGSKLFTRLKEVFTRT
ncbi:hypothetical protein AAHC03_05422 [Spirometra sp. Aus1]